MGPDTTQPYFATDVAAVYGAVSITVELLGSLWVERGSGLYED